MEEIEEYKKNINNVFYQVKEQILRKTCNFPSDKIALREPRILFHIQEFYLDYIGTRR